MSWVGIDRVKADVVIEQIPGNATYSFDPRFGYRNTSTPTRVAVLGKDRRLQSMGWIHGNNLGFPDRDDFRPRRISPTTRRIAVFGDSQSAGMLIERNWTERAQELLQSRGADVELLNFSVDGGGIMNWWATIEKYLGPEGFELDGCLFAVCCDDLYRGLFVRHHEFTEDRRLSFFGRIPGLKREDQPETLDACRPFFFPWTEAPSLTAADVDRLLAGESWHEKGGTKSRLVLSLAIASALRHFGMQGQQDGPIPFSKDLQDRIMEIKSFLDEHDHPCLVVQVPMPDIFADPPKWPTEVNFATKVFADLLAGEFWNGSKILAELSYEQKAALYLRGDAHWNQAGSDRFAEWIANRLPNWLEANPAKRR